MRIPGSRGLGVGQVHTATDYGRDILVNTPDGWEVDEPWRWWDGDGGGDHAFGNPPPGAGFGPGGGGTSLPVFMECTWLIAEQIASMPWQTYRDIDHGRIATPWWIADPQGARLDGRSPGATELVTPRLSKPEFWSQALTSCLWFGEAFIYTPRNPSGQIMAPLWLLHPLDVFLDPVTGAYFVAPDEQADIAERTYFEEEDLIVVRGHMRPGDARGYGVLDFFRDALALAGQVRGFALNTFRAGVPAGYLKVNQPDLTKAQAEALQQRWMDAHGGVRKKIAVLNAVTEFHPLALDANTVALIDMLKITAWEICAMFSVPTSKVGLSLSDSMTYNNAQDDDARFVKDTLRVWVDRFEKALTNRLPQGTYMRVNLDSYLRANTTERFNAYAKALDPESGWMTTNEVRALEELPPLAPGESVGAVAAAPSTAPSTEEPAAATGDEPTTTATEEGAES
jgi:HK97 family phage portal protein